jgi:uncharacterized membrane protein (UPF0127 family)
LKPNHILVAIAVLLLITCGNPPQPQNMMTGRTITPTRSITFFDASGDSITTLHVALAQTTEEISTGLMDVREMAIDEGMLFIFSDEQPRSFWMANTPLSLDMFFVDSALRIRRIHANTTPLSHQSYTSDDPVRYVIETNGGYSIQYDITEGHTILIHD